MLGSNLNFSFYYDKSGPEFINNNILCVKNHFKSGIRKIRQKKGDFGRLVTPNIYREVLQKTWKTYHLAILKHTTFYLSNFALPPPLRIIICFLIIDRIYILSSYLIFWNFLGGLRTDLQNDYYKHGRAIYMYISHWILTKISIKSIKLNQEVRW